MTTSTRPSQARKRTPKDEAAREAALDQKLTIRVDDEPYTLSPADITGLVEMKIRRDTGLSLQEIVTKIQEAPGMDLIGCFMYACEVSAGREPDLEKILGSVSWASDFSVVDGDGEPVPQP